MFEKAGGTSAIQGVIQTGARCISMGQNLVAFCGWRPCAEHLRLPILLDLAGECGGETREKGEYGEMLKNLSKLSIMILINLVCCRLSEA